MAISRDAWRALESADRVLVADPDDALPVALVDDGVTVERIEASSPDERARALTSLALMQAEAGETERYDALTAMLRQAPGTGRPEQAALTAQLRSTMQDILARLQTTYQHEAGAYWVPRRLGGSAPTLDEATALDDAEAEARIAARQAKLGEAAEG